MNLLIMFARLLLIPIFMTVVFTIIQEKYITHKKSSKKSIIILFAFFLLTINILAWLTTSYIYVKNISFILTKIFGTQRLFLKFTILWLGLSFCIAHLVIFLAKRIIQR